MSRSQALQRAQDVLDSGALAATLARRVRCASESEEPRAAAGLPFLVAERIEGKAIAQRAQISIE